MTSDNTVGHGLVLITEALAEKGADVTGGLLGGEYGYGANVENDVFMMHQFCWCESDDCPWCWGCTCPEDVDIYEVRGQQVDFQDWLDEYDRTENRERSHRKQSDLVCDWCRGERENAPNFLHKPSGSKVSWYKWIGRSMEVDLKAPWRKILTDCLAEIERGSA